MMMKDNGQQRRRWQPLLLLAAVAIVALQKNEERSLLFVQALVVPSSGRHNTIGISRRFSEKSLTATSARTSAKTTTVLSLTSPNVATEAVATTPFSSVTTRASVVFDGPEWVSIQNCLYPNSDSSFGSMTVAVGTTGGNGKMVGILVDNNNNNNNNDMQVYQNSLAKIPSKVKDQDAIHTMIAALTGVQCTAPRVQGVGGSDASSDDNGMVSGKVVILGGSEYACFAAKGLAALGSHVSVVSTNEKLQIRSENVEIIAPAVGDDEIGFASFVGDFDSLLDTADDERPSRRPMVQDGDEDRMGLGTTLRLLKERHNCESYVSSMTQSQSIVNQGGVFFGPGKVKDHFQEIQKSLKNQPATFQYIVPPSSFGQTVETLLEKGIVYKNSKDFLSESKSTNPLILRSWSLKDFMEVSMWPQDAAGGGSRTVRYGLPVLDEEEIDDGEFTFLEPPDTFDATFLSRDAWDKGIEKETKERDDIDDRNPYVKKIRGAQGLHEIIVKDKKNSVLFMSAAFCRTCKTLNPKFTYMARNSMENISEHKEGVLYAKADATGEVGKDLGRLLKVEAVPAFQLFREGKTFGPPLSISRIPSKKLDAAIALLESGFEWDAVAVQQAEESS